MVATKSPPGIAHRSRSGPVYSHDVRRIVASGWAARTACSPASLVRPYTVAGPVASVGSSAGAVAGSGRPAPSRPRGTSPEKT